MTNFYTFIRNLDFFANLNICIVYSVLQHTTVPKKRKQNINLICTYTVCPLNKRTPMVMPFIDWYFIYQLLIHHEVSFHLKLYLWFNLGHSCLIYYSYFFLCIERWQLNCGNWMVKRMYLVSLRSLLNENSWEN